ncbi:phosphoglycerate mutase-like protein [Polyplosphaeria fusca]|uniref:Phosphoglycerate mutase-like protein n=1 Tax=Polyplosphaeria fusca TaxID=682080 RepID=A0A9P4R2A0_9PLEO|nr:phosphoglycerate mutase-like protein [Polyplosphaeria fusca]
MLALFLALMAAAWLIEAQDDNSMAHVHGAVSFMRTGERTPIIVDGPKKLTAVGAQQMHTLGANMRGRYISDIDTPTGLGKQQITSLPPNLLNNELVYIQTLDTPYLVASAQAFMQGLYPPYSINSTRSGPIADATGLLANGSAIDFPLDGYQYPHIASTGDMDPYSIYLAGTNNCPASQRATLMYMSREEYLETRAESRSFYSALDESVFNGHLQQDQIDYMYAFEIYDYLSYAYVHDTNVFEMFANDSSYDGVYDQLRFYADQQAWYAWGNTSSSSSDDDYNAMAGRTAAAMILGQLQKVVMNGTGMVNGQASTTDDWHALSLLFGEHEPFVSLASLMMIDYTSPNFRSVPPFASAMVFELFSTGSNTSDTFPSDPEDLWVRFYFHNGTTFSDTLQAYPMFGRGPSGTDMPWLDFQDMMSRIMTNTLSDWCTQCNSPALFCWGVDDSTINITMGGRGSSSSSSPAVSPAVAGVIGAAVTLAVAGLLFAAAMLLGGVRLHRANRNSHKSDLGGFKGSAKLASDADLNLPKNGVPPAGIVSFGDGKTAKSGHERVGSWELRKKEFGSEGRGDGDEESRRGSFEAIEAAMSRPVQPEERI